MDFYTILSTITTLLLGVLNIFQYKAKRKATAEVISLEIKALRETLEELRTENSRLRDEIKELRKEIQQVREENLKLNDEIHKKFKIK